MSSPVPQGRHRAAPDTLPAASGARRAAPDTRRARHAAAPSAANFVQVDNPTIAAALTALRQGLPSNVQRSITDLLGLSQRSELTPAEQAQLGALLAGYEPGPAALLRYVLTHGARNSADTAVVDAMQLGIQLGRPLNSVYLSELENLVRIRDNPEPGERLTQGQALQLEALWLDRPGVVATQLRSVIDEPGKGSPILPAHEEWDFQNRELRIRHALERPAEFERAPPEVQEEVRRMRERAAENTARLEFAHLAAAAVAGHLDEDGRVALGDRLGWSESPPSWPTANAGRAVELQISRISQQVRAEGTPRLIFEMAGQAARRALHHGGEAQLAALLLGRSREVAARIEWLSLEENNLILDPAEGTELDALRSGRSHDTAIRLGALAERFLARSLTPGEAAELDLLRVGRSDEVATAIRETIDRPPGRSTPDAIDAARLAQEHEIFRVLSDAQPGSSNPAVVRVVSEIRDHQNQWSERSRLARMTVDDLKAPLRGNELREFEAMIRSGQPSAA